MFTLACWKGFWRALLQTAVRCWCCIAGGRVPVPILYPCPAQSRKIPLSSPGLSMLGLANCPCLSTTIREAQRPAPHRVLPTAGLVDAQSVCRMHTASERTSQRDRELGRREAQNLQGGRFGQHFDFPNNSQRHQESITAPAAAPRQDPHMLRAGLRADPHAASPHHRFGCVSSSLARSGES